MLIPSLEEAERLLTEAESMNPGPWAQHSRFAAQAAQYISAGLRRTGKLDIDPEEAYILALLHDIGRREGVKGNRHGLDGYRFLESLGYLDAARACLVHPHTTKNVYDASGKWDCTDEEIAFIQETLDSIDYTHYDRLVQLCDGICLPEGFCLIEKRMVDVALRYGFNQYTLEKWRAFFQIKQDFEAVLGHSIYHLLPGVVENTFS
jgi:hypothetical protein